MPRESGASSNPSARFLIEIGWLQGSPASAGNATQDEIPFRNGGGAAPHSRFRDIQKLSTILQVDDDQPGILQVNSIRASHEDLGNND